MTNESSQSGQVPASGASATRAMEVYEALRGYIVDGVIRPNERLIETELAERLQVSRTPVRESLPRLAADGLIQRHRRGWVVREHSAQEVREIYEVRAALEGFAARLAAQRGTDEMLENIRLLHQTYVETLAAAPRDHLVEHNDDFHDAVIEAAQNDRLASYIRSSREYYFMSRIAGFLDNGDVRASIAGHQTLVEALLARDHDRAEEVARSAILDGLDKTLGRIDRR